jgi:hypothetical protein
MGSDCFKMQGRTDLERVSVIVFFIALGFVSVALVVRSLFLRAVKDDFTDGGSRLSKC